MSEVKWIKITTTMFEDEKIDYIESLPEADAILVVWVKLLTLAGKCNTKGYIFLTENIPYTEDMLAHKFRRSLNTVRFALETFKRLGMIDVDSNGIYIENWEKHQNIDALEKLRERDKIRKREERATKKILLVQGQSKDSPSIDIDKELDIDIDKKKNKKIHVAEFVSMTEEEQQKLITIYGQEKTAKMIDILDNYKGSTGKKYKSDYRAILNWVVKRVEEENGRTQKRSQQPYSTNIDELSL